MSDEAPTTHAQLMWDEEGQPLSQAFGDVYFSKANGLEETRHVFLHHNQLTERFSQLLQHQHFVIGETGFGSGLNFLAAWDLWLKTAAPDAHLHFVSVEKYPLKKSDLVRALSLWPELEYLSSQLIDSYPIFVGKGFHRLNFSNDRVHLTLIIDDAALGLEKLLATTHPLFAGCGCKVDAWFLDGFAPSKNPQMWSDALFSAIKNLSHATTTAATFSAAAIVKNGLKNAGFSVQKVTGFGRKREMVKATFDEIQPTLNPKDFINRRSFSPYPVPWTIQSPKPIFTEKQAIIIGGGLAGCHTARALAERGWKIILLEKNAQVAQEGSGNPQGVLYAKLSHMEEVQAAFNLASLQYALDFYRPLWKKIGDQCGVLQLAHKPTEAELHEQLREKFSSAEPLVRFVNADEASHLAGTELHESGLFFPQAGWIDPRKLCQQLIDHPRISVIYDYHATELKNENNLWHVSDKNNQHFCAPVAIICNAKDAEGFEQANHLPIKSIRGQVSYFTQRANHPNLKSVVCAEGYISPAHEGVFCTGATFNLKDDLTSLREQDHHTNLNNLREQIPAFDVNESLNHMQGRVAFRCTLPDYLPAVGPLPHVENMVRDFAPLRKNAKAGVGVAGSYLTGLYINIGHGSRGLAYTPICAELLAAYIENEPIPLPRELANALNPARFVIRDITRNKR